ncbi:MAG TPA: ATP-binding protein [Hanamia sp.]
MIFASSDYLTSFDPEKLVASAQLTPHLSLVQIMVNGKFIPPHQAEKMIFSHDENNINVKWTVTDYNNPLKNQYYYQLKGIDTSWHSVGERGEINLVSLSPGGYTLLLKGENSNGIAASNLIYLLFKIKLPFWRTWWFIGAIILFFLSLFYFFYRYRLNEVRRIERLRHKIARDLHDDIGATLSTIMLYGNSIKKKAPVLKKEDIMNIVNKINKSAGEMIDEMNDIVWTINPKNDNMERTISRMQIFATSLLASKEVSLIFDLDEEIKKEKVSMDKRKNCYLIFKEVLNNAIKHSECTEIEISLHKNHHNIEMKITDNGKGFNPENLHSGNGLDNIRQRATEIGGELNICHPNETGIMVSLVFPLTRK